MTPKYPKPVRTLLFAAVAFVCSLTSACDQQTVETESQVEALGIGPHLVAITSGTAVVSYVTSTGSENALRYHVIRDGKWSAPHTVAVGKNWFVNWADYPSVVPVTRTLWAAHWLVRREAGGYAYDVHAAVSEDAGRTWSEPFLLHDDDTDTEHGFVTLFPSGKGIGAIWLDGRNMALKNHAAEGQQSPTAGMMLRAGHFDASGKVTDEQTVDALTCDCCQTDVAITSEGPVALYRNRSEGEIRDIYISRFVDGKWQEGHPVHHDGWIIPGCPVNGPVVIAEGSTVVVTWFTAAGGRPKVKAAWSEDAGRTFADPIVVAEESVVGYVGAALLPDGSIAASWLCNGASDNYAICYRAVHQDGEIDPLHELATPGTVARMSIPQLAKIDDRLLFVWTGKNDDQYQISWRSVLASSIYTTDQITVNR